MTDWSKLPGRQYGCSRRGGEELIALLQEEPAGKPWESEDVRTWEPTPLREDDYELWAAEEARNAFIDHA